RHRITQLASERSTTDIPETLTEASSKAAQVTQSPLYQTTTEELATTDGKTRLHGFEGVKFLKNCQISWEHSKTLAIFSRSEHIPDR
ncbi:unnamed protein product, partial [Anisakis simplex]|uniref:Uncharacterized protein n=1 Tax=Anisakis simplex TaxID=6269 RepID=A0A0M3JNL5_ANISI